MALHISQSREAEVESVDQRTGRHGAFKEPSGCHDGLFGINIYRRKASPAAACAPAAGSAQERLNRVRVGNTLEVLSDQYGSRVP